MIIYMCYSNNSNTLWCILYYRGKWCTESGTDFKELSEITVEFSVNKPSYTIRRHEITSDLAENEEVGAVVSEYLGIHKCRYVHTYVIINYVHTWTFCNHKHQLVYIE